MAFLINWYLLSEIDSDHIYWKPSEHRTLLEKTIENSAWNDQLFLDYSWIEIGRTMHCDLLIDNITYFAGLPNNWFVQ